MISGQNSNHFSGNHHQQTLEPLVDRSQPLAIFLSFIVQCGGETTFLVKHTNAAHVTCSSEAGVCDSAGHLWSDYHSSVAAL